MPFLSKYGSARHIYIAIPKAGSANHAVGADWTPAGGDVKISKDGGAAANVTNLPVAIAMGNSAIWDFSLTATEMQAAQVVVTVADSATKAVDDTGFEIETYGNASGQHAVDFADAVHLGITGIPNAAAGASGGLLISGSNSGTTTLGALTVTGALTLTGGATVPGGFSIQNGLSISGSATGIGLTITGGATSGDAVSITSTSGHGINVAATGTSKHGMLVTGGTAGTSDGIKAVAGTGGVDIRGNITGNLVGTVSTLTTYTGNTPQTGDSFARLGAPAGASVSADIAGLNNISTAQVKTQVVAALATDTYAEPGQGAPAATATLAAKIGFLFKAWRNKHDQTASTFQLYAADAVTVDQKATVADDATTFTRGEVGSGP